MVETQQRMRALLKYLFNVNASDETRVCVCVCVCEHDLQYVCMHVHMYFFREYLIACKHNFFILIFEIWFENLA